MQFGALQPRRRPQVVDLNLIPIELRRRPFPVLTTGLGLALLGSVLLLYAIFYLRTYADWEVAQLRARVAQAQDVVRQATSGEATANVERQRLQAMRDDYQVIAERQVSWSSVLGAIGDTPPGIAVGAISQSGYTVTVHGTAPDYAAAVEYLDRLRTTDLFLNMSIELAGQASPQPSTSPTTTPTPPPRTPTPPRVATPVPAVAPSPAATANATRQPTATAAPTSTPLPTNTPLPTETPTPAPTPMYDFAVESKTRTQRTGGPDSVAYIRGRVVDADGQLVSGAQLRISTSDGGWTAVGPPADRRNGTFEFVVTRGQFNLQVLDVRSEVASDLYTGAAGSSDLYDYEVVYKRVPPIPVPQGTPGSPTATPTPSATAVSPGPNIASQASLSVTNNAEDARLAVDGDVNTVWNSRSHPVQSIQLEFPGRRLIDGIELVVQQSPAGSTSHELWIQDETGAWTLQTTFQTNTSDFSVLAYRFSPVKSIGKLYVRTIRGPSFVAWREIRVYETLSSPAGTPTPTATTTGPTATVTPTATPTPTGTPYTMPSPPVQGQNITSLASPTAVNNQSNAGKALDGNTTTYWSAGAGPAQDYTLAFAAGRPVASVEAMVAYVDSAGATKAGTTPFAVEVWFWNGTSWTLKTTLSGSYADGQVLAYAVPTPLTSTNAVLLRATNGPNPIAWREIRVIEALGTPQPIASATATGTPTPTPTPTATSTATPTATTVASMSGPALAAQAPAALGLGPGGSEPDGPPLTLGMSTFGMRLAAPRAAPPRGPIAFVLLLEVKSGGGYR